MQINVSNIAVEYDGVPVLTEANFVVHDKEKIALVGRNGCGKTTLLKVLSGELGYQKGDGDEPSGVFENGNPQIGFLKQTNNDESGKTMLDEILEAYKELFDIEKKADDALKRLQNDACEQNVKTYSSLCERFEKEGGYVYQKEYKTAVRKFGFSDDDLNKSLNTFSGGQRTKIALLKLLLSKPDVLLLDEPTNHLDVDAKEELKRALTTYKGSILLVCHEPDFYDGLVDKIWNLEEYSTLS